MNVRDIMRTDVVTARPDLTVRELTRLLSEHGISGVPVVTEAGEVLGVVSASDVVRITAEAAVTPVSGMRWVPMGGPVEAGETEDDPAEPWSDYFLPEDAPDTSWDWGAGVAESETAQLTVSDLMTPVTFTIDSGASLQELADFLVRGKIHRALVLDDGRLQGIVTAMDVMEVVARGRVLPQNPRPGRQGPARGWMAVQALALAGLAVAPPALLLRPETTLPLFWRVVVPLLVVVLLVNPTLWRNACPLATIGMGPDRPPGGRGNAPSPPRDGTGFGAAVRSWFATVPAPLLGLALLLLLVPVRRLGLEESGPASAGLLVVVGLSALVGRRGPRKAGFCNGICPLLAVERLYGQAPLVEVSHVRCPSCSTCTVGCVDLSNRASHALLLGPGRRAGAWLSTPWGAFAAAFPGFVLGYFLADPAGASFPGLYLTLALWSLASWLVAGVLVRVLGGSWRPSLLVLACLAAGIYLWFALPDGLAAVTGLVGYDPPPAGLAAVVRGGVVGLVGLKLWRGLRRIPDGPGRAAHPLPVTPRC